MHSRATEGRVRDRPVAADRVRNAAASFSLLTCGSVDDGKSTLIGRLLWDGFRRH